MEIATMIRTNSRRTLSGIGGIESGNDAAQFILLGSDTVQVCTGVLKHGYELIHSMKEELLAFMEKHGFETLEDFKGKSLQYFTTHAELVRLQREAKKKAETDGELEERNLRGAIPRPESLIWPSLIKNGEIVTADSRTSRISGARAKPSPDRARHRGARRGGGDRCLRQVRLPRFH